MSTLERLKLDAETAGIRGRTLLRTTVQTLGVLAVLLGAWNLLAVPAVDSVEPVLAVVYATALGLADPIVSPLAHVILIAAGAIAAWFV